MKVKQVRIEEFEAKYLDIKIPVKNGDNDIPFDAPGRVDDVWRARIDLDEKRVVDWPFGVTLEFCSKVVDEGRYILLTALGNQIADHAGYVPNQLLPGSWGDYLELNIGPDGKILNWKEDANLSDFESS